MRPAQRHVTSGGHGSAGRRHSPSLCAAVTTRLSCTVSSSQTTHSAWCTWDAGVGRGIVLTTVKEATKGRILLPISLTPHVVSMKTALTWDVPGWARKPPANSKLQPFSFSHSWLPWQKHETLTSSMMERPPSALVANMKKKQMWKESSLPGHASDECGKEGSFPLRALFLLWENWTEAHESLAVLLQLLLLRVTTREILFLTGSKLSLNCVESTLLKPEA